MLAADSKLDKSEIQVFLRMYHNMNERCSWVGDSKTLGPVVQDIQERCKDIALSLGQAAMETALESLVAARTEAEGILYASGDHTLWDERLKLRHNKSFDKVNKAAQSTLMQLQSNVYEAAAAKIAAAEKALDATSSEYLIPKYEGPERASADNVRQDCMVCTATGLILALAASDRPSKAKSSKTKAIKAQRINNLDDIHKNRFADAVMSKAKDMEEMLE